MLLVIRDSSGVSRNVICGLLGGGGGGAEQNIKGRLTLFFTPQYARNINICFIFLHFMGGRGASAFLAPSIPMPLRGSMTNHA